MKSGVYTITNLINGKIYVGSTTNGFDKRWWRHLSYLRVGTHRNKKLQHSWNKYGEESFVFEILELCEAEFAVSTEQYWLNTLDTVKLGYNIRPVCNSNYGLRHSEETKQLMSIRQKGKVFSDETKLNMSLAQKGKLRPRKDRCKLVLIKQDFNYTEWCKNNPEKRRSRDLKVAKAVVQLDLENNYVSEYESAIAASRSLNLKTYTGISNCCNNVVKTASKYIWKWKKDYEGFNSNID